jgi:RHS repeat-associated protein
MDGYKCVAEIDALANKVARFYSWTGESLLGIHNPRTGKRLAVLTDGNKNVVALLDKQGKITAQYAYSPYGALAKSSGPDKNSCPFRFSSEYLDTEAGLVYYNYRYYSPELGRWTKRDSIEESGGLNLYAMVENSPVDYYDLLGFEIIEVQGTIKKEVLRSKRVHYKTNEVIGSWGYVIVKFYKKVQYKVTITIPVTILVDVQTECEESDGSPDYSSSWNMKVANAIDNFLDSTTADSTSTAAHFISGLIKDSADTLRLGPATANAIYLDKGDLLDKLTNASGDMGRCGGIILAVVGVSSKIPGRPFTGKNAPTKAYRHLKKYHGVDPTAASNRLHKLKKLGGLDPADDVAIGRTGDVYNAKTGEYLGSLTSELLGN